jgi:hypothetical protein
VALAQRAFQPFEIQVGRLPLAIPVVNHDGGAQIEGFVRLPDEACLPIGLRVEGDGNNLGAVFEVELANRVNQPHSRFAAIDDRYTPEICMHDASTGIDAGAHEMIAADDRRGAIDTPATDAEE